MPTLNPSLFIIQILIFVLPWLDAFMEQAAAPPFLPAVLSIVDATATDNGPCVPPPSMLLRLEFLQALRYTKATA